MTRKLIMTMTLLLTAGVVSAWAAPFPHQAHLEEYVPDKPCSTCHLADAQSIVPDKSVCLDCHEQVMVDDVTLRQPDTHGPLWALNHEAVAKGSSVDCSACHTQEYCLECHKAGFGDKMGSFSNNMVNVHRGDFSVSHPLAARANQNLCFSCHESRFCDECHDAWRFQSSDIGSPSHRRTFDKGLTGTDIDAIHAGIDNSLACDACHSDASMDFHSWSVGHAREARRSLATCQACHPEGDICLKCHSARSGAYGFNPHPDDWSKIKDSLRRSSNGKTCRKCH
jgi:hypothetical protein